MRPPHARTRNRRGFSLLLVISTIALLLAFWSQTYRETASLIRVAASRLVRQSHSVQAIHAMTALDRALTLLPRHESCSRIGLR
jgi:hypothetical protein